ncbi:MAG: hypothetical protein HY878_05380, partial [Deltaproteobacteria bacterium]|nr:hypothetical protein [Deltaproteobacteria bacterium]
SSLDEFKEENHPDYTLWLYSIPYYYGKDLRYLGLLKERGLQPLEERIINLEEYTPVGREEQIPLEALHLCKIPSDHRINLNSLSSGEGYFPCTLSTNRPKGRRSRSETIE